MSLEIKLNMDMIHGLNIIAPIHVVKTIHKYSFKAPAVKEFFIRLSQIPTFNDGGIMCDETYLVHGKGVCLHPFNLPPEHMRFFRTIILTDGIMSKMVWTTPYDNFKVYGCADYEYKDYINTMLIQVWKQKGNPTRKNIPKSIMLELL